MKKRKIFLLAMVVFSVMLTSFSFYFYQVFYGANILIERENTTVTIHYGESFDEVRNKFYDAQVINDVISFSFVSKTLGYQDAVKPGVYYLKTGMSNIETVRMLRAGDQIPVRITFNNVRLKSELADKITDNTGIEPEVFEALLNDDAFLADYGVNSENVMTLFLPNTYEVYWTIKAEELFSKMAEEHKKFWTADRVAKAKALDLTPVQVSVLASIVQAESIKNDERPTIAGLYLNRLERNIALQADPTLVFALGDFTIQRVLNEHKRVQSPYNTYLNRGLPPGPINLPTISSIDAVLNYEKHDYIYMCAKEDFSGYHRFAKTLVQHNKNAALFQRALNERRIFR
ncbi:endolytic transglycosylase MltG [Roseivirga echinicomitans]|uniref:Endolytic murein transglycosylase n=1 Tax=Roseivirga echinicomitans TaxID=296218 RepID=A0A150XUH5_9BACT|nr:endolytic transglycosylase MltG [Roseivirga echinicomitans]KYG82391.1 aminodeoxychorismate lyase [Roseivirga echinicomitans]